MYLLLVLYALALGVCKGRPDVPDYLYSELSPYNQTQPLHSRKNFGIAASSSWVYLFGGVLPYDDNTYVTDVWAFGTGTSNTWNKTDLTFKRSSHCVTQIGEQVYFIGGTGEAKSPNFRSLNLTSGIWNDTLAAAPGGDLLFPACSTVVEKKQQWVATWGGCVGDSCSDTLHIYFVLNNTWASFGGESSPPPSNGATLTSVITTDITTNKNSHYLVVLGGHPFNDTEAVLYTFNITSMAWLKPLPVHGLPPLAYHTTVKTQDGNLLVFGGATLNNEINSETYIIQYSPDSLLVNVSVPHNLTNSPKGRTGHGAYYEFNRMLIYGGNISLVSEQPGNVWQFVVEKECLTYRSCGECLLNGCFFCNPNPNNTKDDPNSYCVAGTDFPYNPTTCPHPGWNFEDIKLCRPNKDAPLGLKIGSIVAFVVIFILVVAVYVVDWRKGKASSGGYEPIGGM